jgi:hypothetical protein
MDKKIQNTSKQCKKVNSLAFPLADPDWFWGYLSVEQAADNDGLKALFDTYNLDALICTLADSTNVPMVLASAAK